MDNDETISSDLSQQLAAIVAEYLEAEKSGARPERAAYLQRYPHLAELLAKQFDKIDQQPTELEHTTDYRGDHFIEETLHAGPPTAAANVKLHYFGDYELLEEIARGGMGIVYKARQLKLNRIVAVKMILGGQLASDEQVKRFLVEAESAANLNHPGIVPVYEFGEHDSTQFFSMAYVAGDSLASKVARQPLKPDGAAEIVASVSAAIAYAHSRGVIHRDLKPANILLERDGQPRVTDFGLAKRIEDNSNLTQTGAIMGSVCYMSPEQASGDVRKIGPASDIYSLGAVLYELLVGRPPFQAATALETIRQVAAKEPVPPRRLNPDIPRDLETICLKCLEKEPGRRYRSATALEDELRLYLEGKPIKARPVGPLAHLWRWCRRNPLPASLAAGLALALLVGIVTATTLWNQAQAERARLRDQRRHVEALSHMVLRETLDETNAWLKQFFQPVQQELLVARDWAKAGLLDTERPDQLNEHLRPLIEHYPQLSSIMVADERGREHMLLSIEKEPGSNGPSRQWKCRRTRRDQWGDQVEWIEWLDNQPKTSRKVETDYDPRSRPWFAGAKKLRQDADGDNLIYWTKPYLFFTAKELGITAAISFDHGPGTQVIGFDVLLKDVSRFTIDRKPTANGKLLVLSSDGRIVGLPDSTRFPTPDTWKKAYLKKPSELGFTTVADALEELSFDSQAVTQTCEFDSDGRHWWAGMRPVQLGADLQLWILVVVPDSDLRHTLEMK